MKHQQDATKSGRFVEVIDSKTLNFLTFMADGDRDPRMTIQPLTELQGLQYLEDMWVSQKYFEKLLSKVFSKYYYFFFKILLKVFCKSI